MTFNLILFLSLFLADFSHADQAEGSVLYMQLSGSEVDEGNYKQTALLSFEEFDDKCKLRRAGTVKLNKKTRTETRPLAAGKPVMVNCFYTDQRTQYGRSVHQKIVFYPEAGVDYVLALRVDGGKVGIGVFKKTEDGSQGAEVAVQRGYVEVACEQSGP